MTHSSRPVAPRATILAGAVWLFLLLAGIPATEARAAALAVDAVPAPLRPWVPWVLHGVEDRACPHAYDTVESRRCAWFARVGVTVAERGGEFSQSVETYRELWVALPGDLQAWPQQVRIGGKAAAVVAREGRPGVVLSAGQHVITGSFAWDAPPETLRVPAEAGIVSLTLKGVAIDAPRVDAEGRLWVEGRGAGSAVAEALEVRVHRRIDDDIPMRVLARFDLVASGRNQEVLLPAALLEGFVPVSLSSPLPARIEPDGRLRVQVRAGRWEIRLDARRMTPASELKLPATDPEPTREEIWSFGARSGLRIVSVEGPTPIDPQQSTVPSDWKSLPAWRVRTGEGLRFTETRRGDPQPAPDALTLQRLLWLDFDGGGYTVQDRIGGTLSRSWRLELAAPAVLGRAAVDGVDQLVTRASAGSGQGLEVRTGRANVQADSRIDEPLRTLPATGWQHDFQQVAARLNLPPGWRLLAATGVDRAEGSWLGRWNNLLDFFLVLVVAVGCARLWGWRWGLLALLAMVLSWHEPDAPQWPWLLALAAAGLARVVPDGRFARSIVIARQGVLAVLVVLLLPFTVDQVRQTLNPVLERPWQRLGDRSVSYGGGAPVPTPAAPPAVATRGEAQDVAVAEKAAAERAMSDRRAAMRMAEEVRRAEVASARAPKAAAPAAEPAAAPASDPVVSPPPPPAPDATAPPSSAPKSKGVELDRIDPKALVQTGPGLPAWSWNGYPLAWSGPVEQGQTLDLWLLSPAGSALATMARLALLALLLAKFSGVPLRLPGRWTARGAAALCALTLASAAVTEDAHAEMPSPELLQELGERLLQPPECLPACASIARLRATVAADVLQLRLEVHAVADTAVPLPGAAGQWLPQQVLLDGKPAAALARDGAGVLWISVRRGVQDVVMQGSLAGRESLQVPFPLKPRRVEVEAAGWTVEGVRENGLAENNLQFARVQRRAEGEAAGGVLPAFVVVERTLELGLQWQVRTRVIRHSPGNGPVVLEVPLLPGEAVTGSEPRVERGHALVSMGTQAREVEWTGSLREQPELVLSASRQPNQVEVWRLNAGTQWRIAATGIAPIHHQEGERWLPRWQPWPGESVRLAITRPEGIPGRTVTLDRATLTARPGSRVAEIELSLTLRASRGGDHVLRLPEGAVLQKVQVNRTELPLRLEGRELRVPVVPGAQDVTVAWREPHGIGTLYSTPQPDAGLPGVNARVTLAVPDDRWILFAGGPRAGPAILFWGVLLVIGAVSVALGRLHHTPLRAWQWFLLGVGLTQSPVMVMVLVAGWLFALAARERFGAHLQSDTRFKAMQVALVVLTVAALAGLFAAVSHGLLGTPDMQVAGNGSSARELHWFQDRIAAVQPVAWVVSVPMLVYRLLMLAWSLWLAWALLGWLRWAWQCWTRGGAWREPRVVIAEPDVPAGTGPEEEQRPSTSN